jgi:hypothetical protein
LRRPDCVSSCPRKQFSSSIAPSFVEAVAGERNATPDPQILRPGRRTCWCAWRPTAWQCAEPAGPARRAARLCCGRWVLPYVYALRGDRDWRRSPQLTGSRQVSQLAVQAYKLLEAGDTTIPAAQACAGPGSDRRRRSARHHRALAAAAHHSRVSAPGQPAQWQLLRTRFQKAIAEGASTSQVTAISVLASIYLQAVIAASMEEVELFLAPLTARSKVREVLRGLVATRQVHTISWATRRTSTLPARCRSSLSLPRSMPARPCRPRRILATSGAQARGPAGRARCRAAPLQPSGLPIPEIANRRSRPLAAAQPGARGSEAAQGQARLAGARAASGSRAPTANSAGSPLERAPTGIRQRQARSAMGLIRQRLPAMAAVRGSGKSSGSAPIQRRNGTRTQAFAPAWSQRNGHGNGAKTRSSGQAKARAPHARQPQAGLAAGAKAGNSKRLALPPGPSRGRRSADECGRKPPCTPFPAGRSSSPSTALPERERAPSPAIGAAFWPAQPGNRRHVPRLRPQGAARGQFLWTRASRPGSPGRRNHHPPGTHEEDNRVLLDGEDVTGLIRNQAVTDAASGSASFPPFAPGWSACSSRWAPRAEWSWRAATSAPWSFPRPRSRSSSMRLPRCGACAAIDQLGPSPPSSRRGDPRPARPRRARPQPRRFAPQAGSRRRSAGFDPQ